MTPTVSILGGYRKNGPMLMAFRCPLLRWPLLLNFIVICGQATIGTPRLLQAIAINYCDGSEASIFRGTA